MTLFSYVVRHDTGLAPNPFHGFLTLALCTPNHQRIRASAGDWIVGNTPTDDGRKLLFAMCISERLGLDAYFRDPRFAEKKPRFTGSWRDWELGVGDNIYYRAADGSWAQSETKFHCDDVEVFTKDTFGDTVFVSVEFYYFGENAPAFPEPYQSIAQTRQGTKTACPEVAGAFVDWLRVNFKSGVHGKPKHWRDAANKM